MAHSDEHKAVALAALAANGGNISRTAAQLGIPESTLRHWARGRNINDSVVNRGERLRLELADRLEDLAHVLLGALPGKLSQIGTTVRDIAIALGIAIDKMQLLRGRPTAINRDGPLSTEEQQELDELLARRTGSQRTDEAGAE